MKKILGLLLVFGLMTTAVYAGTPDTCVLTVTPGLTYSVAIDTENVSRDFSTVNLGATAIIAIGTATNDGNIQADFDCEASAAVSPVSQDWSITASIGVNQYRLQISTDNDGTAEPSFGGEESECNTQTEFADAIAAGASTFLWAKIFTPTTSTDTGEFSITLSIYAVVQD